ncbi:hypothetical protein [Rhodococcus ruber]|uniref:hypothetical protein n=1 Tax=Rhodococcus ruber TaxID=1830 RepID=UPI0037844A34
MPNRFAVEFCCPAIDYTSDELDALGVRREPPFGTIAYRLVEGRLMAEIGQLVVIGSTIHAVPRKGLTERQRTLLAGAAEDAWLNPPSPDAFGWHRSVVDGVEHWTTYVSVPAETIDATAVAASTGVVPGRQTEASA